MEAMDCQLFTQRTNGDLAMHVGPTRCAPEACKSKADCSTPSVIRGMQAEALPSPRCAPT